MTKQVVVIDKEQFDNVLASLKYDGIIVGFGSITTITLDDDIEKRAEEKIKDIPSEHYALIVKEAIIQAATEQQIISEMKMKEFAEWCSINGWYFYSKDNKWRKHGNGGFEYLTTTELIDKFNTK